MAIDAPMAMPLALAEGVEVTGANGNGTKASDDDASSADGSEDLDTIMPSLFITNHNTVRSMRHLPLRLPTLPATRRVV